ncbi:MAG: hypothetical protein GY810_27290 [Aureispira sp.]|nr:hypothetical protein [Aureispira sp.]
MAKQSKYDERKIKKKFKGESFIVQLGVTKNYLYNLILKCLRNYHAQKSVEEEILGRLHNLQILYKKQLFGLAKQELTKLKELVKTFDKVHFLPYLLEWELTLEKDAFVYVNHNTESLEELLKAYHLAIQNLDNYSQFKSIVHQIYFNIRKYQATDKLGELKQQLDHALQSTKGFSSQLVALEALAFIVGINSQWDKVLEISLKQITLMENEPNILKDQQIQAKYFNALRIAMIPFLSNPKLELSLFEQFREKLWKQPLKNISPYRILDVLTVEIAVFLKKGQLPSAISTINRFHTFLEEHPNLKNHPNIIIAYYQAANTYFFDNQYNNALDELNVAEELYSQQKTNKRRYHMIVLLKALTYYELNELLLLHNYIRSVQHYLGTKNEQHLEFEADYKLLRLIQRLCNAVDRSNKMLIFEQIEDMILDYKTQISAQQFEVSSYFYYWIWASAKLENCPYQELLTQHNQ